MPNTNMDALYPEFWAAAFDALDVGEFNLQEHVSRGVENQVAEYGDSVNVAVVPDIADAADWTPGGTITPDSNTQSTVQLVLNKSKSAAFALTDRELSLSPYNLVESWGLGYAKSLLRTVNKDIYAEALKSNQFIDATGGISEDLVADAETKLSENEVGYMGRVLIGSPGLIGALRKIDVFRDVDTNATSDIIRDGRITRQYGFDIYENNAIAKYTPADLAGAVVHATEFPIGTTTIVCDAFNDDANPVRAGDILVFGAGDTAKKTVISTTQTAGDTTGITFYPALTAAVANDATITITPVQSALAMVPGGIAFAARAYASIDKPGARSAVINVRGLPIRVTVWTDSSTLNTNVQYDILYGTKLVNDKRVVRLVEDM